MDYQNFIKNKVKLAEQFGFTVQDSEINQWTAGLERKR